MWHDQGAPSSVHRNWSRRASGLVGLAARGIGRVREAHARQDDAVSLRLDSMVVRGGA